MALTKVNYQPGVTVITAENLNAIQDEIIFVASEVTDMSQTKLAVNENDMIYLRVGGSS